MKLIYLILAFLIIYISNYSYLGICVAIIILFLSGIIRLGPIKDIPEKVITEIKNNKEEIYIRAYKAVLPKGVSDYYYQVNENGALMWAETIEELAANIKMKVDLYIKENEVFIDFIPYHSVITYSYYPDRLCFPLNEEEQYKFWDEFNRIRKEDSSTE